MVNVFYTWFGPPSQAKVHETKGSIRPDVWAPNKLAAAAPDNVRVKFCCMTDHVDAFKRDLHKDVDIVPVEDPVLHRVFDPDIDDLEGWVHSIVRYSLKPGNDGKLIIRNLVNAKNIWSMWCMYNFGGYHLDTGVYPENVTPVFPVPKTFGVPVVQPSYFGAWHTKVTFDFLWGKVCSTIVDSDMVLQGKVLPNRVSVEKQNAPKSAMNLLFDVWLMRSPARHIAAKRALEFYIRMWVLIEKLAKQGELSDQLYKSASRGAIMSAVATGITHSGFGDGCLGMNLWKSHIIPTRNTTEVPELKMYKLGFSSHR